MAIKICLDAGHYGKYNRSPAVKDYYESEMNWKLHNYLKSELESYGMEVWQTRKDQKKDMFLTSRGKAAKGADLFLSIHSNAVGSQVNETVDYPVVYVPIDGSADEIGRKLAQCIARVMQTRQSGRSKSRKGSGNWDYYSVIHGAAKVGVPGLILEHSFHTNTRATQWLMVEENLQKLAKEEAKVIAEHFGITEKPETVTVPSTTRVSVYLPVLKRGDKGESVRSMQLLLIGREHSCGDYGADGSFGPATEKSLTEFQQSTGLVADGICENATWSRLLGV